METVLRGMRMEVVRFLAHSDVVLLNIEARASM